MGESAMTFCRQLYSNPRTKHVPVIGDMNFSLPSTRMLIGNEHSSIYYIDAMINKDFIETYNDLYSETPNAYSYYSYMIMKILNQTLQNANSVNAQLDYIKQTEFVYSDNVSFDFETNGEVKLDMVINELI